MKEFFERERAIKMFYMTESVIKSLDRLSENLLFKNRTN